MSKYGMLFVFILVVGGSFSLAACGRDETPTPPPEPTSAPTSPPLTELTATPSPSPTGAPAPTMELTPIPTLAAKPTADSIVAGRPHTPDLSLTDKEWQWQGRTGNGGLGQVITVPYPEQYTLFFNKDGTFTAALDCSSASGTYATDGIGGILMELGPATAAECGPDSLATDMANLFGPAQDYIYEEDGQVLVFKWAAGGPWDRFQQAGGSTPENEDSGIVGLTWAWLAFQDPGQINDLTVQNPEGYTLTLNPDGTAAVKADCNQLNWTYILEGSSLTFESLGPTTLAFCGEESLDQQYITLLAETVTFVYDGSSLFLNLMFDSGDMVFAPADDLPETPAPEETSQEAEESTAGELPADYIQLNLQGLASSYEWQVIGGSQIPPGPGGQGFPNHIVLGFDSQDPLAVPYPERRILYLFPVQAYIDLYKASGSTIVQDQVDRLRELIDQAGGRQGMPVGQMPLLPPPNSVMDRWVQFTDLDFGQGQGIRYISDSPLRQSIGLWTNETMDYYYQGLTKDGRYYISLKWPVSTSALPNSEGDASEGQRQQASSSRESYDQYVSQLKAELNGLNPGDWAPDLSRLDAMISSLSFGSP